MSNLSADNENWYHQYGEKLLKSGDFLRAERHFKKALAALPSDLLLLGGLASAQMATGHLKQANETCDTALKIHPGSIQPLLLKIAALQRLGYFGEAIEMCRALIGTDPNNYRPWVEIIKSKRIDYSNTDLITVLEGMILDVTRPQADKFHIHRALGKAFDDLGNYRPAMAHFEDSNKIARELGPLPYDSLQQERDLHKVKSLFSRSAFQSAPLGTPCGIQPVLIVGMIRSGTTLLDSMLSRLENVRSAGEVRFWTVESARHLGNPNLLTAPTTGNELGQRYLTELSLVAPGAEMVTDKMPLNYKYLGLIKWALPCVKIVHLRRHPADAAISIYTSDFGPQPPSFAFDKGRIVHFYRIYQQLMAHWREALPNNSVIEIDYEELVSNPEPVMRRVLDYLGVPWSDRVLDRMDIPLDVNTPSRWQARQDIYTSSVHRWKNYYPWLGELAELLSADDLHGMETTNLTT